jgi:hypothetical protein
MAPRAFLKGTLARYAPRGGLALVPVQKWRRNPVDLKAGRKVEVQLNTARHEILDILAVDRGFATPPAFDFPPVTLTT